MKDFLVGFKTAEKSQPIALTSSSRAMLMFLPRTGFNMSNMAGVLQEAEVALIADLFLYCYESQFMAKLHKDSTNLI